jgi:hypothetical protein
LQQLDADTTVPKITSICAGVITKKTCKLGINLASTPLPTNIARLITKNGEEILKANIKLSLIT